MKAEELHDLFRVEVHDSALPQLWSSTEVYTYIDDAQKMFCRLVGGIADSTSPLTKLKAKTGNPYSPVSDRILKIRAAYRLEDHGPIQMVNYEDVEYGMLSVLDDSNYKVGNIYKLDNTQGQIRYMVLGMEASKVRWMYVPAEDQTVGLVTYRLPLEDVTEMNKHEELEVDPQHHQHLLHWVKCRAYGKQDAETFDRTKRDEFKGAFLQYCEQARQERERREHKPRLVGYGGI